MARTKKANGEVVEASPETQVNPFETYKMRVKLTFTESVLGSANSDPDIHGSYIASKGPNAMTISEEIEAIGLDETIEKGMTVFPRTSDGKCAAWDYQIRGFFKGACGFLKKVPGTLSSKCTAFKKKIDGNIFVQERLIPFENYKSVGECQRPLRASTPQGDRVALAHSEELAAGCTLTFTVECFLKEDLNLVREWLNFGKYNGFSQWRNSGKGRFTWEEITE